MRNRNITAKMCSERGASSIIEATIVMPLVILVLCALIYMGCYVVQIVIMYSYAQRMAVETTRIIAYPGYEYFGDMTKNVDFVSIEQTKIDSVMGHSIDPYRYFKCIGDENGLIKEKEGEREREGKRSFGDCVVGLINDNAFINSGKTECTISAKNNVFNQKVNVEVSKEIPVPDWLAYIGVGRDKLDITVTAVAVTSDPAEFVRNTDMVFDVATFLANEVTIGGKTLTEHIDFYKEKINGMKQKFKIGD